jgi:hypothetical protein
MPWDIKKNVKGEYCLFKKDDGSMVKGSCRSSRSETAKMMAAMYAKEPKMMESNFYSEPIRMEVIQLAAKYKIEKKTMNGKEMHCVMNEDGTMVKDSCNEDHAETMMMMKEMMSGKKMMENVQLALSMKNPVWLGCAVTNRPHIRLKEHPLSIVDIMAKSSFEYP